MSPIRNKVLLGVILQQAGLVSAVKFKQALEQENKSQQKNIGEILASREEISQKTVDFFVERWFESVAEKPKKPIGQYLKQAGLLTDRQIQIILEEQKRTESKFGELAIAKKWLKQATVDFFLHYLVIEPNFKKSQTNQPVNIVNSLSNSQPINSNMLMSSQQLEYSQKVHEGFVQIKRKLLKLKDRYSETTLDRVLWWTGGQSILTQKLFELLAENTIYLTPETEIERIDYLVHTKFIDDWENNELAKHLLTIRDRLLNNWQFQSNLLLKLYQKILNQTVQIDSSKEQQELINIGLVVKQREKLIVANRIYRLIFNLSWVNRQLKNNNCQDNLVVSNSFESNFKLSRSLNLSGSKTIADPQQFARTIQTNNNKFFQPKNILLLLTFIGLLSFLLNNVAQRIKVKIAFQEANQLLEQKLYARAIIEYDRLLDRDSNYHEAWTYRGYAFGGLQRYQEMQESCSTATVIESNAVYAWNCRGEALFYLGRNQEAITAFDKAIAIDKTEPVFSINKSRSLKALGRNEESMVTIRSAIKILEQIEAVQQKPNTNISKEFAVALTFLGNSYVQNGQQQAAIDSYTRALTYVPDYFPAQIGKGIALNIAKRYDQARDRFNGILDNTTLTPTQQAQTLFYLGQALCSSQQNLLGIAALEKAIDLKPDYKIARQALKRCTQAL